MVSANVPTLQGGASNATTLARGERLGRIAWENRLPHIQLVQSVSHPCPTEMVTEIKVSKRYMVQINIVRCT